MSYEHCYSSPSAVIRGKKLQYAIQIIYNVALGYLVTEDAKYAEYVHGLLLHLADVMPKYLVYEGYSYNEYADCNPRDAAKNIENLPAGCKKITGSGIQDADGAALYSGYWSASRLGTSGMDGATVQKIALAYDFTASSSVYTEQDRAKIEENVIEEAAYLGRCDSEINNKAIGNRAGVAIAGLVIDSYDMARFGLDGFISSINDWFLEDGSTSESAAYALQTLNGLVVYGKAFRDYSDPEDSQSEPKYTHLNVNTDTMFDQVWQYLVWSLQSDFNYAPLADSYVTSTLSASHCEYLAIHFPQPENIRLSAERTGTATPTVDALFHRDPSLNVVADLPFTFRDAVFPFLSQGYLRTGEYGRNSTVVLDASNYGSHHHRDSLNLVYWKDGHELLNDLGYLWDHVDIGETRKTCVHNTVVVDGANQITDGRNGSFHTFATSDNYFKAMQASSNAYKQANVYHRTVAQIEHESKSYLVDIFRVEGGSQQEYVFHFPNMDYSLNEESDLKFWKPEGQDETKFILQIQVPAGTSWVEVSDLSIKEQFIDDRFGYEMAGEPFPEGITGACTCDESSTGKWCHWSESGYQWKAIDGYKTKGVHFANTNANSKASLVFGGPVKNQATLENGLVGKYGSRYHIEFYMKAAVAPTVQFYLEYQGALRYPKMMFTTPEGGDKGVPSQISEEEWIHYGGYVDIGRRITEFNKMGGQTSKAWQAHATISDDYTLSAFLPAKPNEWVYLEKGWGQRNADNSDKGTTLPYFYIKRESQDISTFVCVYEGHVNGLELVKAIEVDDLGSGNVGIRISTTDGDDYVLSSFNGSTVESFNRASDCSISVETYEGNLFALKGTHHQSENSSFESTWSDLQGETLSFENNGQDSWFVIEDVPTSYFTGQAIQITYDDGIERSYLVFDVAQIDGKTRVYTRKDGVGFRLHRNGQWRLSNFVRIGDQPPATTAPDDDQDPSASTGAEVDDITSPDNPHNPEGNNNGLSPGEIAGAVVGALVGVAAIAGGAILGIVLYRKHKRQHAYDSSSETSNPESAMSTADELTLG